MLYTRLFIFWKNNRYLFENGKNSHTYNTRCREDPLFLLTMLEHGPRYKTLHLYNAKSFHLKDEPTHSGVFRKFSQTKVNLIMLRKTKNMQHLNEVE